MNDSPHAFSRRGFCRLAAAAVLGAGLWPRTSAHAADDETLYDVAEVGGGEASWPKNKRLPFGWQAKAIGEKDKTVELTWRKPRGGQASQLRICMALGTRDESKVEVFTLKSLKTLGTFDIRFTTRFQMHALPLDAVAADLAGTEGVGLRQTAGDGPLWIFTGGTDLPAAFQPHLLRADKTEPYKEFFARLGSLASIQPFGWMEGCVLDGLLDLSEMPEHAALKQAAVRHLGMFVRNNKLIYENHADHASDGRIYGIEGTLPFAALARLEPQHPLFDLALEFWQGVRDADDCIVDGKVTSCEGTYTVGYPLAVIARARKSEELEALALTQLKVRQARLFDGKRFARVVYTSGRQIGHNWSRGVTWQLLGLARTLAVLRDRADIKEYVEMYVALANWALKQQLPNGLWSVFLGEPELTPDSSGSAGIAAALAIGVKHKWLPAETAQAVEKTQTALLKFLTPDGFLGGVAQANKGGDGLQRAEYRVMYQMGMGLMAQLIAARS